MNKLVKNLTNSPYNLIGKNGSVRLPAMGSVEGEFNGEYLELLKSSQAVSVHDIVEEAPKQSPSVDIASLRNEYLELTGNAAGKKWSAIRIKSEIDKLAE